MKNLTGKKFIVGISASIAAYKTAELVRGLKQQDAQVQVVMTQHAQSFVTPLTLQALSGNPVLSNWSAAETQAGMDHIQLARWADAIICAPTSADLLARLAQGLADDLLTTLCLATTAPLMVVPAMNPNMWAHPAVQANVQLLQLRGVKFLGPALGTHACGEEGLGRMLEPDLIIEEMLATYTLSESLAGQHVLITAGPTQEALDPIRYLTNHSSGKMGFALAQAAYAAGANVTVIAGPVTAGTLHPDICRINVTSAQEMLAAVLEQISATTIFIAAAAVADYQPREMATHKLKKSTSESSSLYLELVQTPDILSTVAHLSNTPFTVGFALETENSVKNAEKKLQEKKLDMIIVNQASLTTGFNADTNAATVLAATGLVAELPLMTKTALAQQLMEQIANRFHSR